MRQQVWRLLRCLGCTGGGDASSRFMQSAITTEPCVTAAEASTVSSRRMEPCKCVRCRLKKRCNATRAQQLRPCLSAPAPASTRRCTHAVRRPAQQLLHVHNRAAGSSLNNDQAVAVAARASRRHFDGVRRKCGACAAGGRGRRLHSTNYNPSAARAGVGGRCGTQSTQNDHGACLIRMEGTDDRRLNKEMGSGSSGSGAMLRRDGGGQRRLRGRGGAELKVLL